MRGYDRPQATMLTLVNPEQRVPANHPIGLIKQLAEVALKELSPLFEQMYSEVGRPSIPPERGGFEPPVPRGFLWAEFGPCLGHYLARPKASAPKRVCSPRIRLCFSSLRHQSATRCSAASIEFSLVDRSKFTRTSLTASLIEKPGLAPVFNTKVIGECLRWVPFWILNLAGSLESSVQ